MSAAEILEGIRAWVEIESHTADLAGVQAMVAEVEGAYRALGAATEREPGQNGKGPAAARPVREGPCSSSATRISQPATGPRPSHSATLRRLSISLMATARPVFPSDAPA